MTEEQIDAIVESKRAMSDLRPHIYKWNGEWVCNSDSLRYWNGYGWSAVSAYYDWKRVNPRPK